MSQVKAGKKVDKQPTKSVDHGDSKTRTLKDGGKLYDRITDGQLNGRKKSKDKDECDEISDILPPHPGIKK